VYTFAYTRVHTCKEVHIVLYLEKQLTTCLILHVGLRYVYQKFDKSFSSNLGLTAWIYSMGYSTRYPVVKCGTWYSMHIRPILHCLYSQTHWFFWPSFAFRSVSNVWHHYDWCRYWVWPSSFLVTFLLGHSVIYSLLHLQVTSQLL